MSEAAIRKHDMKRNWAEPGSQHDRLVRLAKIGLPIVAVAFLLILAIAPFDQRGGDVSFILDKKGVDKAAERMRIETARYTGEDNKGNKFEITANRAIQPTSDQPIVNIEGMMARLSLGQGPLVVAANQGRYDLDSHMVDVNGPVRVVGPAGYRLETRDVNFDLKQQTMQSHGPVTGAMNLGQFQANKLSADLRERKVVLDGGARLKIIQGAVR
ncbi:LPS export ABC transporter periplasmic protein LptC [Sphingomonas alba]|uniref:LPS export ABC transporter periplasmic protein LptC n=1 Tax=Sphingomonas alba TaxID=2908208 RepID=A0ABT0RMM8_9SPHN|nr:LPS export ABC transporter periplasmic protein LptC [Sphingomonas alba]MCL6683904.1 LPS export ABC transporter periplasmic protein LptC [Sphingomonas alba]